MSMSRKEALKRVQGLALRVEEHLNKLESRPDHLASSHWRHEVRNWLRQIGEALPALGGRTAEEWSERLRDWVRRAGG
jgi:hypothetical protein